MYIYLPGSIKSFLFLAVCLLLLPKTFAQPTKLSYRFSMEAKDTTLHAVLAFTGDKSGKTVLQLPDQWASEQAFYNAVQTITVSGKEAVLTAAELPSERIVTHAPGATITVRYTLKQDFSEPLDYPKNFRAVIQPDYFQFTGYSLFVFPQMDLGTVVNVTMDWSQLPADWKTGNSLAANKRVHKSKLQLGDMQNAVFVAGDFRTYVTHVKKKPVHVFVRGNDWQFADSLLVQHVEKIISMERRFWNDFSEPSYFVSMIPYSAPGSRNGTSLYQSFMLAVDPQIPVDAWFDYLLAHEYFHRWNGTSIILGGAEDQSNSWFSEGFTDYYTYKLLFENGILTFDQYVTEVNHMITDYYLSPVRNEEKKKHGANYWKSREYQQIPYKKGFVYALYMDHLIRTGSKDEHSLNDVMFELRNMQEKHIALTDSIVAALIGDYAGQDVSELQRRYIDNGETIPVAPESIPGTTLEHKMLGTYEAGFDVMESLQTLIVSGVVENSEAWKAGLRDGQVLKGISVQQGDATFMATLQIEADGGTMQTLTFLPMAADRTEVPQFSVTGCRQCDALGYYSAPAAKKPGSKRRRHSDQRSKH